MLFSCKPDKPVGKPSMNALSLLDQRIWQSQRSHYISLANPLLSLKTDTPQARAAHTVVVEPMQPSISVIIPLYNHERYISSTLYSVLSQHYPAREIIVVDDGSSDDGMHVVQTLAQNRPEIIYWKHSNRGAHNTINAAIHRSSSDLVSILNSDDIYHPERLKDVAASFAQDPDLDAVATGMDFINGEGAPVPFEWYDQAIDYHRNSDDLGKTLVNGNIFVTTSNLVVKRSVFEKIGHFSDLRYAHDLDFFLRLVSEGRKIQILPRELMSYRIHATNTISEGHLKVKLEWATVTAFYLARLACKEDGWRRVSNHIDVLKTHNLMDPVMLLFGYFQKYPAASLDRHPYHDDEDFKTLVRNNIS